jgi:mono/diheme cytochrome c family protein
MQQRKWLLIATAAVVVGCAHAAGANARAPLGAMLTPSAKTGPQVPLRFDPNAKVIISRAAGLPPASFLASQADRGQAVYEGTCATCHSAGQLVGQGFVESWNDRRVYDFYAVVRGTMPLDKPGGLTEQEYLDVIAYLLKANHAPAGADSLRADTTALRNTKIAVHFP